MSVRAPGPVRRGAVVLVHGAGSASSAIWDLRFRDYSLMRKLACAGYDTYAADFRGFGGSTMPPAMRIDAERSAPAVRASVAARDLEAMVRFAVRSSSVARADLVAWSWGCDVTALFAGQHPELVRRLVLYAPVYDRRWPTRHKTRGAWRVETRREVLAHGDPAREEPEVWQEHVGAMFRFSGPSVRLPNGPYRDIYGPDAPVWDAAKIRAPVLIIRGDADRASQAEPVQRLYDALVNAPEKRLLLIAGAGHFLMRERRYRQLHGAVLDFLGIETLYEPQSR